MPLSVLSPADAVGRTSTANRGYYSAMRPVLIGPRAALHRFAVTAERASLGAYAFTDALEDTYPDKATDSVVDLESVILYADNARLNYFNKYIGVNGSCQPSEAYPNRVRAANYIFKTGNDYDRSTDFKDRDVAIGDIVQIRRSGTILNTTVTGFVGEPVASTRGTASGDDNNKDTQTLAVSVQQVSGTPINDVVATADGSAYQSLEDGYITRTYTVTVTQASTGGDAETALLLVESADGLDDVADVVPSAFGDPTNIGTKGLTATWDIDTGNSSASLFGIAETDFVLGQQWTITVSQAFTAPTATAAGTYTGTEDDNYIVTVTRGGLFAGTDPQITVTTANGSDSSGPTDVTASATAITVGHYDVTISFNQTGLAKGDVYYIAVTAAGEAQLRTIVTADDIPEAMRGEEVDLRLFVDRDAVVVPLTRTLPTDATNWEFDADGLAVNAGIYLTDSEFTDDGDLYGLPLDTADLYVQYREWVTDGAGELVILNNPDDIEDALGTIDVTNPIAQAASLALANTHGELSTDVSRPGADTTDTILCVALGGDPADLDLWTEALQVIADDDRAYTIVPLSDVEAVRALVVEHVNEQSADELGYYRRAFLPASVDEDLAVVDATTSTDEEVVTATIAEDEDAVATAYTVVTASSNAAFVTNGVREDDTLRINFGVDANGDATYDEYEVEEVISNTTLRLRTGPDAAISVARRIEVWRVPTKAELVTQLTTKAAAYDSASICYVWPDRVAFGGTTYEGYLACAAVAALAGSVPSQQGLRNVGVAGIDSATRASRFFTSRQIRTLRDGGVFVISQTPEGTIYVASAVTTDMSSVPTREEMMNRNADMLRKAVQAAWAPYVGSGNVVSNLHELLSAALASLTARLRSADWPAELGPPVADLRLASLSAVTGAQDEVDVEITAVGMPAPLNRIRVRLPISE